ncbi:hypothetical protein M3Y96_00300000 [Aphelenchoides besseyi]|nr:hypothetical protein M3Y96_00300000 [Aphelenchoides besseyi]
MAIELWDYDSTAYVVLLRIHEFTLVLSLILGFYFLTQIYNLSLIHVNLRILLCNLPLLFIIMNVSRIVSYIWEYYLYRHPNTTISPFTANCFCLIFRFTEECGVGCLALSIPQIAIERSFATVFRSTYESYGSRLGIMMTVKTYIGAILFSTSLFIYQIFNVEDFKFNEIHATCRLEAFSSLLPLYFGVWFMAIFITIGSTGIMFVAYYFNRKECYRKKSLHLSLRYQFRENVNTLRSLLPPITAFLICDFLGVGILYIIFHDNLPDRQIAIALQVIHIIPQGYCIFTVSWFMYSFSAVRQRVKEDLQRFLLIKKASSNRIKSGQLNSMSIQMRSNQNDHFTSLVDSWNLKFVDRISK